MLGPSLAYLLIVVNFQSWLDLHHYYALPGALAGICWTLLLTHTTLNCLLTGADHVMACYAKASMFRSLRADDEGKTPAMRYRTGFVASARAHDCLAMIIGMCRWLGLGEVVNKTRLWTPVIGRLIFPLCDALLCPCVFSLIHGQQRKAHKMVHQSLQH